MLTPRYYQEEAICSIFQFFADHPDPSENPVVALPTGTGKALVIAEFCRRAVRCYPQTRILIATHVKELVGQNHAELLEIWPSAPAGIYSAGLRRRDLHTPLTFCGIGSIAKRIDDFGFIDLVIVDECHMISHKEDTQYRKALEALRRRNPLVRVIGLTATPYRLGLGTLTEEGSIFTHICCDYTTLDKFNELLDWGYLSPLIPKRTENELDVEGVGVHAGEFVQSELQAAVDKEVITASCLEEAVRLGTGRRHWLVFCAGIKHADHARAILDDLGVPAVSVHSQLMGFDRRFKPLPGETPRDMHIRVFKQGYVGAMVGDSVFSTGFNFKPIDYIIMLRPTMSAVWWVQGCGRGTRPSPETNKKNCLVADFAGNTRRLGPINDPVIPRRKGKKGTGMVPYKTCPHCQTYNHARVRFCIECGAEFPQTFAVSTSADTAELIRKNKPEEAKPTPPPEDPVEVRTWDVQRVEYEEHHSKDASKPPSLRVTYYCGARIFNEWLCLQHGGFAQRKAREAWRLMAGAQCEVPETVEDALTLVDALRAPRQIRVLMKAKFPEVVGYEFESYDPPAPLPPVLDAHGVPIEDDDIPF